MPNLNALVIFAMVVEAKGFSAAARRLKMPVSTVSRKISELENALNVRLLERSTRRLRLTEIGSEILAQAQMGVEIVETVKNISTNLNIEVSGTLRLSAPTGISNSLLIPLVSAFQAKYPAVKVQIMVTDRYVDLISEGLDIVLRVGEMADSALITRSLLQFRHRLLATPAYLETHPAPKHPRDLFDHNLLSFSLLEPEPTWEFFRGDEHYDVKFEPYFLLNEFNGFATMLLSGVGIGQFPSLVMPELVEQGQLVEIMPEWRFAQRTLSFVHLGNHHMPRVVRLFKELTFEMVPNLMAGVLGCEHPNLKPESSGLST